MKVPMVHSYYEAMTVVALLRVVNSKTLTLLFQDHTVRSHFIQKALARKHVRKTTVQERLNNERKSVTLYSITWKGLDYVADQDSGLHELLLHQSNMSIFNHLESKAQMRAKLAMISNSIVVAHSAGASIPLSTFGSIQSGAMEREEDGELEEIDGSKTNLAYTLRDFYRDYLDEELFPLTDVFEPEHSKKDDNYIVFHERSDIKAALAQESERGDIRDFQSGRYTGIIESHLKSVMMYSAPLYTMPWSRWLVNAEMNAYRMWGRTSSITDIRQQSKNLTMAAVIVNNARDFAYHFLGQKRRRERGEVFGGSFAHVYVIPNDHTGILFLNWLMLIEDDVIHEEMARMAIQSGNFEDNDFSSAAPFALRSCEDIETAVLLTMDAKRIIPIKYYAEGNEKTEFRVICFDWQVDYLKRVLPANVSYWTVPFRATLI